MDSIIIFGAKYLYLIILAILAVVIFRQPKGEWSKTLKVSVITAIIAIILTKLAGALYFDPRPFTHGVKALIQHEADNGFPSDHTILSFTAALLALKTSPRTAYLLLFLAVLVGISRVAAGIHNPLDIVAATLIAIISYLLGQKATTRLFS